MSSDRHAPAYASAVLVGAAAVFTTLTPLGPGFGDSAELGAAAVGLGVPHPTGFPLDVAWLRLWSYLPLGSLAYRQNLAVALTSSAALAALAQLVRGLCARLGVDAGSAGVAGVFAAVAWGSWATFFGTALTVEVYSTAALLVLLAALELSEGRTRPGRVGLLAGLALCAHVTAWLGVGLLMLSALATSPRGRRGRAWVAAGVGALLTAGLVLYLPLASAADPPLDWGDPETLGRLWGHLSAERIRGAYAGAMMGGQWSAAGTLGAQLAELGPCLPLGLWGLGVAARIERRLALWLVAAFAADLAYGALINPMGVADRQVGHLAGAALVACAGLGVGDLLARLRDGHPSGRWLGPGLASALAAGVALGAPPSLAEDGSSEAELLGSGGSLMALPPRAVFVCRSDDVCAGALFARYAEGARPDLAVVVEQHLWEPAERRRLEVSAAWIDVPPALRPAVPTERARLAARVVARLGAADTPRPVFFEEAPAGAPAGLFVAARVPPFVTRAGGPWIAFPAERALTRWEAFSAARLGRSRPAHPLARAAWSRGASRLGKALMGARAPAPAALAFERAVWLDPGRAAAWTNLGVARAATGSLDGALEAVRRALALEPHRPTARLDEVRFLAAAGRLGEASRALVRCRDEGVWDRRFDALAASLAGARRRGGGAPDPPPPSAP